MWGLPGPGIEPVSLCVVGQIVNYSTTRAVLGCFAVVVELYELFVKWMILISNSVCSEEGHLTQLGVK